MFPLHILTVTPDHGFRYGCELHGLPVGTVLRMAPTGTYRKGSGHEDLHFSSGKHHSTDVAPFHDQPRSLPVLLAQRTLHAHKDLAHRLEHSHATGHGRNSRIPKQRSDIFTRQAKDQRSVFKSGCQRPLPQKLRYVHSRQRAGLPEQGKRHPPIHQTRIQMVVSQRCRNAARSGTLAGSCRPVNSYNQPGRHKVTEGR